MSSRDDTAFLFAVFKVKPDCFLLFFKNYDSHEHFLLWESTHVCEQSLPDRILFMLYLRFIYVFPHNEKTHFFTQ